MNVCVAV
jgi:hypothetical protein